MFRRTSLGLLRIQNLTFREINICVIPFKNLLHCKYITATKTPYKINKFVNKYTTNSHQNSLDFEKACVETLESLADYFEDLVENTEHLKKADVSYSDGVLTVNFGNPYGIYVINRQSPNQQIWLSSPTSGPKRYDLIKEGSGYWLYKHDGVSMHELLQKEIKEIVKHDVDFLNLVYGSR